MSNRTKKIVAITTIVVLVLSTVFFSFSFFGNPNDATEDQQLLFTPLDTTSSKVYATYQGGAITEGELNLYINISAFFNPFTGIQIEQDPSFKDELAKDLAARKYLAGKAKAPADLNKKVDSEYNDLKQQIQKQSNNKAVEDQFLEAGFKGEDLKKLIEQDVLVEQILTERIKDRQFDFISANHILVGTEIPGQMNADGTQSEDIKRSDEDAKKRALEVKKKLEETNGDFQKLAKEYSDDQGSKESAGKIEGDVNQYVEEFKKASLSLPIGKISDPIKTEYGYHVLRVNERKKMKVTEASEDIQNQHKYEVFVDIVEKELKFALKEEKTAPKK